MLSIEELVPAFPEFTVFRAFIRKLRMPAMKPWIFQEEFFSNLPGNLRQTMGTGLI